MRHQKPALTGHHRVLNGIRSSGAGKSGLTIGGGPKSMNDAGGLTTPHIGSGSISSSKMPPSVSKSASASRQTVQNVRWVAVTIFNTSGIAPVAYCNSVASSG